MKKAQQSGFTLIELVVVIVILGILAATAIPRFVNMGTEARAAKLQAALAALKSGAAVAHAAWLAGGGTAAAVSMEGTNNVSIVNGYPDVVVPPGTSGIVVAAGGLNDYDISTTAATATVLTIHPDNGHTGATCQVQYTEPSGTNQPPTFTIDTTGC